ncbi:MAG: hypothetical protein HQK79_21195 [Desulfobacterales bacterium]|nr:hypothetical protein [Desulfobacterales bacterium]
MKVTHAETDYSARIKVIGIGRAGINALNYMIQSHLSDVQFIAIDTCFKTLNTSAAELKIYIGLDSNNGYTSKPQKGTEAAKENWDKLKKLLTNSQMVFIITGLGGSTGTGAAPVLAEISKSLNILTVAVVTTPFSFEGTRRMLHTAEGMEALHKIADMIITIPFDQLKILTSEKATVNSIFKMADEALYHSVRCITDLRYGYVNISFKDFMPIISKAGMARMGIGIATGGNRAIAALEQAIYHPLMENISIYSYKGVLMNITASNNMTMEEVLAASQRIYEVTSESTEIIWNTFVDEAMGDRMQITVIATGIESKITKEHTHTYFRGFFEITVEKSGGNIKIPDSFLEVLDDIGSENIIIFLMDGVIHCYSSKIWEKTEQRLVSDNMDKIKQFLCSRAYHCKIDEFGNLNIPKALEIRPEIGEKLIFIGVLDHFEIWQWDLYEKENSRYSRLEDELKIDKVRMMLTQLGL